MPDAFVQRLIVNHPDVAAQTLERFPAQEIAAVLEELDDDAVPPLLMQLTPLTGAQVLQRLPLAHQRAVVASLPAARAAQVVARMATDAVEALLQSLPRLQAASLRQSVRYPVDSVGAMMHVDTLLLNATMTAGEALAAARTSQLPVLPVLFVVDARHHPIAFVEVADLWLAPAEKPIVELFKPCPRPVAARTRVGMLMREPQWALLSALPVIDGDGAMLGIVLQSDALRLMLRRMDVDSGHSALADAAMAMGELVWNVGAAALERTAKEQR